MSYGGGYGSSRGGGGYGGASGGYSNGYDGYSSRQDSGYSGGHDYSQSYSNGYDYPRSKGLSLVCPALRTLLKCTSSAAFIFVLPRLEHARFLYHGFMRSLNGRLNRC